MKKLSFKSIFIPTISLFIICLVVTALLSATNALTKEKIAENDTLSKEESMRAVCKDAASFEEVEKDSIYKAVDQSGNIVGFAISTTVNGYGGQVKVMTGIANDKISAIDVYYNDDETPGLGKNTSNDSFTKQFSGLDAANDLVVDKDFSGDGQKVDAVTSATISSRAVVAAVNEAVEKYAEYYKDELALSVVKDKGGEQ